MSANRRLARLSGHVSGCGVWSGEASGLSAAGVVLGAGGAALAGHVAYEIRKHGLAESWRKSLRRKGTAFALTQAGRWAGIRSGLLHFSAVWRQKRMAASGADEEDVAAAVGDMHAWFFEQTGELNDATKKEEKTRAAYAGRDKPTARDDEGTGAEYTREQVAEHSSEDDCWLIIRGRVYEVTPWLRSHPGGPAILQSAGGSDATEIFTAVEHSPSAHLWLRDFLIGTVAETPELPAAPG